MSLHRLYWILDELEGDKDVYVEYPAEELYAILSLESHRYQAGILGKNLGTVPPDANAGMARHNFRKMYVAQYEIAGDPGKPKLRPVPAKCVARLNTHDMPPFQAFLDGIDIGDRLDLGFLDAKAAPKERKNRVKLRNALANFLAKRTRAKARNYRQGGKRSLHVVAGFSPRSLFKEITRFLADSLASIVLVNVEDLWQEVLPQNVPATNKERPNWRRRIQPSIEEMRGMTGSVKVLSNVFADRTRPIPL